MSHKFYKPARSRLQRSELAVPGSSPKMFEKALNSAADFIFLDLEDAVSPNDKVTARENVIKALKEMDWRAALNCANAVLSVSGFDKDLKALYCRGLANLNLGFLDDAKDDLMVVYYADNSDVDVRNAISKLKEIVKKHTKKEIVSMYSTNVVSE